MNDALTSPDESGRSDHGGQPAMQAKPIHDLSEFEAKANQVTSLKTGTTSTLAVLRWPFSKISRIVEWLFGVISMIGLLTICAAIPILQFMALGYLLEISTRIVHRKKVREGFVGIRRAARIGGFALGTTLVWLPAYNVSGIYHDAHILLADADELRPFDINLSIVIMLTSVYTMWAWIRGGKIRHFLWPAPIRFFKSVFKRDLYLQTIEDFWIFVASLHLKELFVLGFCGFLGAAAWLFLPVLLCIGGTQLPEGLRGLATLFGLPLLALVLVYLPIMQTRYAVERRFKVFLEIKETRAVFKLAPIALWISMLSVWAFALPVYLAKIQLTPREVFLLPTLVFVIFAWPSRILMGWAYGRADKQKTNRNIISIWLARLAIIPVVSIYAGVVFLSRYTSWYGDWSLFEQHALLIPIPLLGG